MIAYSLKFHIELFQLYYLLFEVNKLSLNNYIEKLKRLPQELIAVWFEQQRFENWISSSGVGTCWQGGHPERG